MAQSDDRSQSERTLSDRLPASPSEHRTDSEPLPFLPGQETSEVTARQILKSGDPEVRRALIAELISYAPWEEIWSYISRDELRDVLPKLDLPPSIAEAWRRYLL